MSRVVDERGRLFHEQPSLVGCCFAVSRTLYERLWGFDRDMRSWGVEDLDLGLKCWLLGSRLLIDPEAVIGHRFRKENETYSVPAEHVYANRLRMALKTFGESVWTEQPAGADPPRRDGGTLGEGVELLRGNPGNRLNGSGIT